MGGILFSYIGQVRYVTLNLFYREKWYGNQAKGYLAVDCDLKL